MFLKALARAIGLATILALHLGLSGCASWFGNDFQNPEVRLVKVDVIKAKLLEQRFSLRFRVDNPNASELPIRRLAYAIQLNDTPLAEGWSEPETIRQAARAGILLPGLSRLYATPPAVGGWLLGFAALTPHEIETAIQRLVKAIT